MNPIRPFSLAALWAVLALSACSSTGSGHTEVYGEIKGGYEVSTTR